jgi:hypothetical protein
VNRDDAGVIEGGGSPRFLLEALQSFRIGGEARRQNFDGDVPTDLDVRRPVDFTHGAGPEP